MISARPWSRFAVVAIGPLRRSRAHLAVRSNRLAPTPQESLRFLRARGREPEQSVMAHLSCRCRRPLYVTARYTALYCRNRSRSPHFTVLGCPRIFNFVYLPTRSRCTIPMRLTAIAMGKPLASYPTAPLASRQIPVELSNASAVTPPTYWQRVQGRAALLGLAGFAVCSINWSDYHLQRVERL